MRTGIQNIGINNRIVRLSYGIFFFVLGVWGWSFLMVNSFHFIFKLYLFIPFYLGFLGIYQAIFGFCVYHSHKRTYDMR